MKILRKKNFVIPCFAICVLAVVATISSGVSYDNYLASTAIEPAGEVEMVNINVDADLLRQPLAITDEEVAKVAEVDEDENENNIYDASLIKEVEDPSVNVNDGFLLEDGGAYLEAPVG